jgi:hypothetical protein
MPPPDAESAPAIAVGRGLSFFREAARRRSLTLLVVAGFAVGVAYRAILDRADERTLGYFLLSGIHGAGIALTVLIVQIGFASAGRSRLGSALRQLPLAAEIVVRALVMTVALIVVGLLLQAPPNCRELSRLVSDCRWSSAQPSRFGGWSAGRCSRARCLAPIIGQPGGA